MAQTERWRWTIIDQCDLRRLFGDADAVGAPVQGTSVPGAAFCAKRSSIWPVPAKANRQRSIDTQTGS